MPEGRAAIEGAAQPWGVQDVTEGIHTAIDPILRDDEIRIKPRIVERWRRGVPDQARL
jgi:hypothetical protein